MRKLTFEGFLKQYVAELSGVQTASVHKLADCLSKNPRLKEPLFLYALAFNIAIFKNKANIRRNGTSLSSQKVKQSEKHVGSHSEEHRAFVL